MAEAGVQVGVCKLKCPICLDFFFDPVQLHCGHNFCLTCIRAVWNMDVSKEGPFFCPECQILLCTDLNLQINTDLQKAVQDFSARELSFTDLQSPELVVPCDHCIDTGSMAVKTCLTCDASLCPAHAQLHQKKVSFREHTVIEVTGNLFSFKCVDHREELKLFCQDDGVSVCSLCVVIGSHKNHQIVRLQEACADFKKVLEANQSQLLERKQQAEHALMALGSLFTEAVSTAADYRQRISEKYCRMRTLIEEDEQLMMKILETEEFYLKKWLESKREVLECDMKETEILIDTSKSLAKENNQLAFLQYVTSRGLGKHPMDLRPLPLVETNHCEAAKMMTVEKLVDELLLALCCNFPRKWSHLRAITLDPETAHPKLEVSEDNMEVRWSKQPFPEDGSSQQINSQYSVLAQNSFSSGQHYWEVIVHDKPYWLIGVACGSVPGRGGKSQISANPRMNKVSWCLYHGNGQYLACHDSQETLLPVGEQVKKLGVWVDFSKGELSFYNADTLKLLHSFSVQCLESAYPTFNPCIDVNDQNRQPLILFHPRDLSPREMSAKTAV